MKTRKAVELQHYLERIYDIPFYINERRDNGDAVFYVAPANDMNSLFALTISFKQRIRVIIEIKPQKFAADMIRDMSRCSHEKRMLFIQTADVIMKQGCKSDIRINGNKVKEIDNSLWAEEWNSFYMRFTKSPVVEDDSYFDELSLAKEWADLMICLMLSLLNVEQLEGDSIGRHEGGNKQVLINRYERNPVNRKLCINYNGCFCKICGFDFQKKYGDIGRGFIHVHHIVPVSNMGEGYCIDPKTDLIPVCPNCHSMLHSSTPPLLPDELMKIIGQIEGEHCGEINTDKR